MLFLSTISVGPLFECRSCRNGNGRCHCLNAAEMILIVPLFELAAHLALHLQNPPHVTLQVDLRGSCQHQGRAEHVPPEPDTRQAAFLPKAPFSQGILGRLKRQAKFKGFVACSRSLCPIVIKILLINVSVSIVVEGGSIIRVEHGHIDAKRLQYFVRPSLILRSQTKDRIWSAT